MLLTEGPSDHILSQNVSVPVSFKHRKTAFYASKWDVLELLGRFRPHTPQCIFSICGVKHTTMKAAVFSNAAWWERKFSCTVDVL
jgi:hypothetical protein